jgi:hypothetical protein
MDLWTFINKETKKPIHAGYRLTNNLEFADEYFFSDKEYYPIWVVDSLEKANFAYSDFTHPQYAMFYESPSTDEINILDWEIIKI